MQLSELLVYLLKFYIPVIFSMLFRAFGLGYRSRRRLVLGISVYTVYLLFVPGFLMFLMGYGEYTHIAAAVMLLGCMSVLIFSSDTAEKTIFLQLTQSCFVLAVSVFVNMLRTLTNFPYRLFDAVLLLFCLLFFRIAMCFFAKPLRYIADHTPARQPLLILLPFLAYVLANIIPVYPAQNFAMHPVFSSILMIGICTGYFMYLYIFYCNLREISRLKDDENKLRLLETEIASYQDYIALAKQSRHDLRHHNALLLEYLDAGNTDAARAYLREAGQSLAGGALQEYCSNTAANALFRIYERRAGERKVSFRVSADIPEELPLRAPEFGGLLSNILENALQAAGEASEPALSRISVPAPRQVSGPVPGQTSAGRETDGAFITVTGRVEGTEKGAAFLLEVRNTVPRTVRFSNGIPQSGRAGGGTGIRSVLSVVRAHQGMADFRQEGGCFITRILLPL